MPKKTTKMPMKGMPKGMPPKKGKGAFAGAAAMAKGGKKVRTY